MEVLYVQYSIVVIIVTALYSFTRPFAKKGFGYPSMHAFCEVREAS